MSAVSVTLDQFYAGVVADIRAAFPAFRTVEFDRDDREGIPAAELPACLLSITEFEDADEKDPNTEQWAAVARIEAQVILGYRTPSVKLAVRKAATALAVWLRMRRFSDLENPGKKLRTGAAMVQGCFLDDFDPQQDQYDVWRVEWSQQMDLGASVWFEVQGPTPTPVFSWAPRIGLGHENDYSPLPIGGA